MTFIFTSLNLLSVRELRPFVAIILSSLLAKGSGIRLQAKVIAFRQEALSNFNFNACSSI